MQTKTDPEMAREEDLAEGFEADLVDGYTDLEDEPIDADATADDIIEPTVVVPFLIAGGNPNWTPRQWEPMRRMTAERTQTRSCVRPGCVFEFVVNNGSTRDYCSDHCQQKDRAQMGKPNA